MATHDYSLANQSGASFRTDLNNALAAIQSNNSNSSSPATTVAYQWWADTTTGTLKIRNSANDGWVELLQLDGTLTLEDGSASTPALAFRDDLNTGIFSSAADTFNVATGGVERMELGATTIFNEDGADVDFRIEGTNKSNLFYVDAGNDRIGIGTNSPTSTLFVVGNTVFDDGTNARIDIGAISSTVSRIAATTTGFAAFTTLQFRGSQIDFANASGLGMTFDSNGSLLIGLSSSLSSNNAKLQVAHTDANADIIVHRAGNNANPPSLNFQKTRNASIGNYSTIVQDDDELGSIRWGGADGSNIGFAARIVCAVDGTPGANDMPGRIQFHTSADGSEGLTERLRIHSTGVVQVMSEKLTLGTSVTTGGASEGNITVAFSSASQNGMKLRDTHNAGATNYVMLIAGSVVVGSITGTTGQAFYNNLSDYRSKENDVKITDGIEKIKLLRPIRFNYKVDKDTLCDGFFAHEVTPAVPTAVTGEKDAVDSEGKINPQMLDTGKIIPLMTAALQEAISKIETLETKVAALESA